MNRKTFEKRRDGFKPGKIVFACGVPLLLLFGQTAPVSGNPTGGAVVAGSATIGSAGQTLTINQSSRNAIINWQQFSIANGELTKFIVPNSSSATLNRVLGGNPSAIYGSLQSNGIVYLVNPSGIVVGPGGRIDTAGFMASTLDVSNQQFLSGGSLHFTGTSDAAIDNEGIIHASGGDVYLIAKQVTNNGTLSAPQGTVGLAAGSDILFQQGGNQHLFVQATPAGTIRATGVTNAGTIQAAAAELKAAGGNAYALAINNTGSIAVTGYKKVNGQVYLTADGGNITNSGQISARTAKGNGGTIVVDGSGTSSSGTVLNSGTLDASATAVGGHGGSVTLKNSGGATIHSGTILAKGGQGGAGGSVDVSGATVQLTGFVNTTTPGGLTGTLVIDPATWTIAASGGDQTGAAVAATLATTNTTLDADTLVTINDAITWTSANTLTLSTSGGSSAIIINQPISGVNGGLTVAGFNASTAITTGSTGTVNVANFILKTGIWTQSSATLPAFTASHDFEVQNGSTFVRVTGGVGTSGNPLQIADVYGLQGLASPSGTLLGVSAELVNDIDASGTATWNGGAGFVPIGSVGTNFTGTFDGQQHIIDSLHVNTPNSSYVGLFGEIGSTAIVENVGVTNVHIVGNFEVGGLVGGTFGTIRNSYSSGTVALGSAGSFVGGLVGGSSGALSNDFSFATVTGGSDVGGLVGANGGGTMTNSYSTGAVSGSSGVGGLVGANAGAVTNSFWDITTSGTTFSVNGTGATTTQLESQNFILANSSASPTWDFTNTWTTDGGTLTPQLVGFSSTGLPTSGGGSNGTGGSGGGGGNGGGGNGGGGNGGGGNGGGGNGGGGNGGGGSSSGPTPPSTSTGGAANGGSNIVPPVLTQQPTPPVAPPSGNNGGTPPMNYVGNGTSGLIGQEEGGWASSSSNGSQVGADQLVSVGSDGLNNSNNPQVASAIGQALSPEVLQTLTNALTTSVGSAGADKSGSGGDNAGGGDQETILGPGEYGEMDKTGVKNIPPDQAPAQLKNAMDNALPH